MQQLQPNVFSPFPQSITNIPNRKINKMSCCSLLDRKLLGSTQKQECEIWDIYQQKLSAPMLWIGIYVAAASLICSLAMAVDAVRGFRHRKLWFPCKFFTLNAASLTLLAVAMKLPVDLTTSMRHGVDQLAKLGSTVFMCTVMGNFMPSLGAMGSKELLMNVTALAVLVITMAVNVSIQFYTGAISVFKTEHALVMFSMLVLLVIISFSALTVPTSQRILELKYGEKHTMALNEDSEETEKLTVEKLKENVKKYWIMAESGGPQFVMATSATCSVSGAISCLTALLLVKAVITEYLWRYIPYTSSYYSDYKWSTFLIFRIQSIGVVVGTMAPAFRWLTAICFKCSMKGRSCYRNAFKIDYYWIQRLVEWKKRPLGLRICARKYRILIQCTKNLILDFCIGVQMVIVVASKTVQLVPIFLISMFLSCCKMLQRKVFSKPRASELESETSEEMDLRRYVLQLENEAELPKRILTNISNSANQFIDKAKKQQPKNLKELLEKSVGFKGVAEFDNHQLPHLHSDELPNCWSLPIVTLTSIAIALPNIRSDVAERLLCSVSEGFSYIRLIEKSLDTKINLVNIRSAADAVWLGVELYCKWLDKDLRKMALKGKASEENLQRLGEIAKNIVMEFKKSMNGGPEENPLNWPIKVVAANSMYRISQTILIDCHGSNDNTDEKLFEQLSVMIADILGACLTNLPRVITMKCYCSGTKKREESVQEAARLLGETKQILKILQQHELSSLDPDQAAYIDEWRAIMKPRDSPSSISSSNNQTTFSDSGDLHIAVD